MSISALRPQTQILLAVIVPLCCVVLGIVLVWPPVSGLRTVREELETTHQAIEEKERLIEEAEAAAAGRPLALAVATREEGEPILFLRQLSALIGESGASLAAVQATKLPPVPAPQAQGQNRNAGRGGAGSSAASQSPSPVGGQRPVLPATVGELTDNLTVEGTFGSILSLLVRIESFERILSVSRCRISSGGGATYPRLRAVFTLSRFVAQPEPASPTPETGATQPR
jgi:hypothetical protein